MAYSDLPKIIFDDTKLRAVSLRQLSFLLVVQITKIPEVGT